jgi:hypothetical protein
MKKLIAPLLCIVLLLVVQRTLATNRLEMAGIFIIVIFGAMIGSVVNKFAFKK